MAKTKEPTRPKGVPVEATFNSDDNEWELGETDAKGNPVGEWQYWWGTTGHLCCRSFYEDHGRKNTYTRFHPDGTYSVKGVLIGDHPEPNSVIYCQKSRTKTPELILSGPEYKKVFRVEETYIRKGLSKWKNFDAKDRRIDLDGTVLLTVEAYATNFPGFELPDELAQLVELQNELGIENFAEGFALMVDDKGLLKASCGADGNPLASRAKQKAFLASFMPIGAATGTGSGYFFWNDGAHKTLREMPVVVFGDEGGFHVVAENLAQLLQIVGADVEPMIDFDEVSYYKTPDDEPSDGIGAYRKWLKATLGVAHAKKPDVVVKKAQRRFKGAFETWLNSFR